MIRHQVPSGELLDLLPVPQDLIFQLCYVLFSRLSQDGRDRLLGVDPWLLLLCTLIITVETEVAREHARVSLIILR